MTPNSKMAWGMVNKLYTGKKPETTASAVTPNQVVYQLLVNGKLLHKRTMVPQEDEGYGECGSSGVQ